MVPEEIYVLNKKIRLLQPADGFRTCLDSVMLAAACPAQAGDHVLDLGTGVGGAGLCVLYRVPDAKLTGIEIQPDHVDLAIQNAAQNNMTERAEFICTDVKMFSPRKRRPSDSEKDSRLRGKDSFLFDHVIANPPYLEAGTHLSSPSDKKAKAHNHDETTLTDWIDAAFRNLKSGGSFTIIHRADQTDKIILGLGKRFGAVEIIPLWPKAEVPAKRVIIRALKDRRSPATLHSGIVLHQENGDYTDVAEAILRQVHKI